MSDTNAADSAHDALDVYIDENRVIENLFGQEKYGYDGKQVSHLIRVADYIERYIKENTNT